MAINYQAKIDLIVSGLDKIKDAEQRIKNLLRESKGLKRGGTAQRGTAALASVTRGEKQNDRRRVRTAERRIELQSKLNSATDVYKRKLQQLNRAGGASTKELKGRVQQIQQAFEVGTRGGQKNLRLTRALATELTRVVESQRELNRLKNLSNKGADQKTRNRGRIDALRESGTASPLALRRATTLNRAVGTAASTGDQIAYNEAVRKANAVISNLEREYRKSLKIERDANKNKRELDRAIAKRAREEKKAANTAKREASAKKSKRGKSFQNIGTGVGFPLLFGAGPASVGLGAIGGITGGLGGSVLGSAIGQQLDNLGGFAIKAGEALNDPINALDELIKLSGAFGRSVQGQQDLLKSLGLTEVAALQAAKTFEQAYGTQTTNQLRDLSSSFRDFQDGMMRLAIVVTRFSAGPLPNAIELLTAFMRQLAAIAPKSKKDENAAKTSKVGSRLTELRAELKKGLEFTESGEKPRGFYETMKSPNERRLSSRDEQILRNEIAKAEGELTRLGKERRAITKEQNKLLGEQVDVVQLIKSQLDGIADVDKRRTKQERMRLTARRDYLAAYSGQTEIKEAQLQLDNINERIKAQKKLNAQKNLENVESSGNLSFALDSAPGAKLTDLNRQQTAAEQNLQRAQSKTQNNTLLAQRQIVRETDNLRQAIAGAFIQYDEGVVTAGTFNLGQEKTFKAQLESLKEKKDLQETIASIQLKQSLVGVNEVEKIEKINALAVIQREVRDQAYDTEVRITKERDAQFMLQKKERKQGVDRQLFQSQGQFKQDMLGASIKTTSFFGESAASIEARELQTNIDLLNQKFAIDQKIANLEAANIENKLSQDQRGAMAEEIAGMQALAAQQERNSEVLNRQLALQDRYREALGLTTPVVDSLFNSITSVVDGTKTAQEAFADFLKSIADMLMKTAAQMIAQYIAIGIARMFAGFDSGSFSSFSSSMSGGNPFTPGGSLSFPEFADGGSPPVGKASIVGERGPELFVPKSSGTIIPNHELGGGGANVVVNVDATGSKVEGDEERSRALGKALGTAIKSELIKQKRPGGILA